MFTAPRTAVRSIRSAALIAGLSLAAVACGGEPTRADLMKALDKSGLDDATSNCVADKMMNDRPLLNKTAKGEQSQELVDIMTSCMLGIDDEAIDATTVADASEVVAGSTGNAATGEFTGPDAAVMEIWRNADAEVSRATAADACPLAKGFVTWRATEFPTTIEGVKILNIFEMGMMQSAQTVFADKLTPEQNVRFTAAISANVDAGMIDEFEPALAADKAAFETVINDLGALVDDVTC